MWGASGSIASVTGLALAVITKDFMWLVFFGLMLPVAIDIEDKR